jgi:hypothetical protein
MNHRVQTYRKVAVIAAAFFSALSFSVPTPVQAAATAKLLSTNFTLVNLDKNNPATGSISYLLESGAAWPG